jgi:hypothetical protein
MAQTVVVIVGNLAGVVGGARRFGELRRLAVGISEKMLIQQLRAMEADRIVARKDFQEIPPRSGFAVSSMRRLQQAGPQCAAQLDRGVHHLPGNLLDPFLRLILVCSLRALGVVAVSNGIRSMVWVGLIGRTGRLMHAGGRVVIEEWKSSSQHTTSRK